MVHPAEDAIRAFWERRSHSGVFPIGIHATPIIELIAEKLAEAGIEPTCIMPNKALSLPGSYGLDRPWDLVVAVDGVPVGAIEMTIQDWA